MAISYFSKQFQLPALALLIALLPAPLAHSEECEGETCIDVVADDENHVVITVKKGKPGSIATIKPKPRPSASMRPATPRKPWIPWAPKPVVSAASNALPKFSRKPVTAKPRKSPNSRVKRITGREIADQVKRALPSGVLITQPTSGALLREPVNFITTVPTTFQTVIIVLEIPIFITLRASYRWDFGDGEVALSSFPGAPYPAALITHRYREPGEFEVSLRVTWNGTWRAGALSGPIRGSINQSFERVLLIHPADTLVTD